MRPEIAAYLHRLEHHRRVTPTTLRNYRSTLSRYEQWLDGRAVSEETILQYMALYSHAASANTIRTRLLGLAKHAGIESVNVCKAIEIVKPIEALTMAEANRLFFEASKIDIKLGNFVTFMIQTGLRFSEFVSFSRDQILNTDNDYYIMVMGKGQKLRQVPLSYAAINAVSDLPKLNTSWSHDNLRAQLALAGRRAGLPYHVIPHMLRASFISIALNEKNHQAIFVAAIVGHTSVDMMLQSYYKPSLAKLASVVA